MRKTATIMGILALALWMPGCSNDDPVAVGGFGQDQIDMLAAATTSTVNTITVLAGLAAGPVLDGVEECTDVSADACEGGGEALLCNGNTAEVTDCVITGVGSLTGTATADFESGIITLNMTLNGTTNMSGTIQVVPADGGSCFGVSYNLSVSAGGVTQNLQGSLEQCEGGFPTGALTAVVPSFNVVFEWFFDGTSTASFVIFDLTTEESLAVCNYDMILGTLGCD